MHGKAIPAGEIEIPEKLINTIEKISRLVPAGRLLRNEPMNRHTSFQIGGPAAAFVLIQNERELQAVLRELNREHVEHMMAGNGSNLLVADEGYPGVVLKLSGEFENIKQDGENPVRVWAGSACRLSAVSSFLTGKGLAGFEFASGIPGSIGGAVYMNAGAYGGEMKDVVESVSVMDPAGSDPYVISGSDMDFAYRHSRAAEEGLVVLGAGLELKKGDPAEIASRVAELQSRRNAKQPVSYPSAGSAFKRPSGGFAAALIEDAGLKGYKSGGAEVSEKHAGFIINTGGATACDVLAVMRHVRETVYKKTGIMLEPEVKLINCSL